MPISIAGSGTITGISAGGLPDDCITTADIAAGAVTPAKTTGGPAFSAFRTANQTISNAVDTKIQLTGELFDTANCFDSTTNYRFTPNVAGYYNFSFGFNLTSSANVTNAIIGKIWKNGAISKSSGYIYSGAGFVDGRALSSGLIYMNGSTDYVELYSYVLGSGTLNVYNAVLEGYLARPA
jgi:hypothetical protein